MIKKELYVLLLYVKLGSKNCYRIFLSCRFSSSIMKPKIVRLASKFSSFLKTLTFCVSIKVFRKKFGRRFFVLPKSIFFWRRFILIFNIKTVCQFKETKHFQPLLSAFDKNSKSTKAAQNTFAAL